MSLNTDYFIIFKKVSDGSTINYLASQMNARDFLPLLEMRSDADADERLRVRAKVFDEYPVVYIRREG